MVRTTSTMRMRTSASRPPTLCFRFYKLSNQYQKIALNIGMFQNLLLSRWVLVLMHPQILLAPVFLFIYQVGRIVSDPIT